jgi:nitroimidazol reductase NimA-like FMN-containing flavoprotein (pyridoxamine 5'-phosphate oxidase superfamily)
MAMARRARRAAQGKPVRIPRKAAALVTWERACRVATAGSGGIPHVVPVCHVLHEGRLYFGSGKDGQKIANIRENPRVTAVVDVYSDAWAGLHGVMLQGRARLLEGGPAFRRARALLYRKYPQYPTDAALDESDSVIVEVTPTHVFAWGLDD